MTNLIDRTKEKENMTEVLSMRLKTSEYNALKSKCKEMDISISKALRAALIKVTSKENKGMLADQKFTIAGHENMSTNQVRDRIGMEDICKMLRYDEGLVIAWLKHKAGKNWYQKWHGRDNSIGYKDIILEYKKKND